MRLMKKPMEKKISTQISHKKLTTYPLNPKISWAELGTSPTFFPVKERPLAVTLRMPPCTLMFLLFEVTDIFDTLLADKTMGPLVLKTHRILPLRTQFPTNLI